MSTVYPCIRNNEARYGMELKEVVIQVLKSWQVWAAAGVIVLYVFLVNYVSRLYRRNRSMSMPAAPGKQAETPEDTAPASGPDDDINLGEKEK